jgi:hypothetical protein
MTRTTAGTRTGTLFLLEFIYTFDSWFVVPLPFKTPYVPYALLQISTAFYFHIIVVFIS